MGWPPECRPGSVGGAPFLTIVIEATGQFGQQSAGQGNDISPLADKLVCGPITDLRLTGVSLLRGALELLVRHSSDLKYEYSKDH